MTKKPGLENKQQAACIQPLQGRVFFKSQLGKHRSERGLLVWASEELPRRATELNSSSMFNWEKASCSHHPTPFHWNPLISVICPCVTGCFGIVEEGICQFKAKKQQISVILSLSTCNMWSLRKLDLPHTFSVGRGQPKQILQNFWSPDCRQRAQPH